MIKPIRTQLILALRRACALLLLMLVVGCYAVHYGLYDGAAVAGDWRSWQYQGATFFTHPIISKPAWNISTYSQQKGELYFSLSSRGRNISRFFYSVTFPGDSVIRIIFHDKKDQEEALSAKEFLSFHNQTLQVGGSEDFTVILPQFKIGNTNIPQFSARFRWSNRKYRKWVPVQ